MEAEKYVQEAYHCILQNDFERAIECFEMAIAAQPDRPDYYFRCSVTYARSNRMEQALAYARKAVQMAPAQQEYVLHLHALEAKQFTEQARKELDGVKNDTEARGKAIKLLEKATSLDPLCGDAFVLLALIYEEIHEYKCALKALNEAITLYPQDEHLDRLKCKLYQKLDQHMKS